MKEYMLLIRNQIDHDAGWSAGQQEEFLNKCRVYIEALTEEGKLISAQPLVREGFFVSRQDGDWKEGAFTEAGEVIVGYYHILADDLDDAIAIAKRNPEFEYGTTARVEVRPVKMNEESTGYAYPEDAD
jgi:hypothetical protein